MVRAPVQKQVELLGDYQIQVVEIGEVRKGPFSDIVLISFKVADQDGYIFKAPYPLEVTANNKLGKLFRATVGWPKGPEVDLDDLLGFWLTATLDTQITDEGFYRVKILSVRKSDRPQEVIEKSAPF